MSTTFQKSTDTLRSSEVLIRQAQDALDGVDKFFQAQGVEPATIRRVVSELMTEDVSSEVSEKVAELQHDISREVSQKRLAANAESGGVPARTVKRPRPMI